MVIAFCGHAQFSKSEKYEKMILDFLEERVRNHSVDFYLGGYGKFDWFAYECCKKYQATHTGVSLVFVTPYLHEQYQRNHLNQRKVQYDSIVYPPIEKKPLRLAIVYRNQYMVETADLIIAYVSHDWGGAYATYRHAKRLGKEIYNLGDLE